MWCSFASDELKLRKDADSNGLRHDEGLAKEVGRDSTAHQKSDAVHGPHRTPARKTPRHGSSDAAVLVPLQVRVGNDVLSFISTTMIFGTPVDVTLSDLALETFFPADEATAAALQAMKPR